MRVTEAVTDAPVCGHCRAPWTVTNSSSNGCCDEDRETAPPSDCTCSTAFDPECEKHGLFA